MSYESYSEEVRVSSVLNGVTQNASASLSGAGFNAGSSFGSAGFASEEARSVSSGSAVSNGAVNQIAADLLALNQSGSHYGSSRGSFSSASHGASSSASFGANASFSAGASANYVSEVERALLSASAPIDVHETEEINVNFAGQNQRGIWVNRAEVAAWRGDIPISQYLLNDDSNPEVITKRSSQVVTYIQELAIRYLRPPTPPAPGEIVIKQENNVVSAPAPPLVIRQQPPRAATPEALVIREAPPQAPAAVGRKVITISGKRIPPPARKVVIERLAAIPSKPQAVLVERWLPYAQTKRRVIFQGAASDAVVAKPRNVVVQWEAPRVEIRKEFKFLGVIRANPVEYVTRYGSSLLHARDLPSVVREFQTYEGHTLAADYRYNEVHELYGDVRALGLIDLDREGLGMYRSQLSSFGGSSAAFSSSATFSGSSAVSRSHTSSASADIVADIFNSIDRDHNNSISVDEAARVLLKLNSRIGRAYGEDESRAFFSALDVDHNGELDIDEFRRAFERLL